MAGGLGMILRQADWSLLRLSWQSLEQLLEQLLVELVAGTLGELFRYLLRQLLSSYCPLC